MSCIIESAACYMKNDLKTKRRCSFCLYEGQFGWTDYCRGRCASSRATTRAFKSFSCWQVVQGSEVAEGGRKQVATGIKRASGK